MASRRKKPAAKTDTVANVGYEARLWEMADALRGSICDAVMSHEIGGEVA